MRVYSKRVILTLWYLDTNLKHFKGSVPSTTITKEGLLCIRNNEGSVVLSMKNWYKGRFVDLFISMDGYFCDYQITSEHLILVV